ncbi:hypothetical protein OAM69_04215 [bacterium]|nr:hypothetical protein [bacterium]
MKTAISIPDKVFQAAERAAAKLGVSRSELYVSAVQEYIERHGREGVTDELNDVYGAKEADSQLDAALAHMQSASIATDTW